MTEQTNDENDPRHAYNDSLDRKVREQLAAIEDLQTRESMHRDGFTNQTDWNISKKLQIIAENAKRLRELKRKKFNGFGTLEPVDLTPTIEKANRAQLAGDGAVLAFKESAAVSKMRKK